MAKAVRYQPECCTPEKPCGQTTTYATSLNRGVAYIVVALVAAVHIKGRNDIHLRNDTEITQAEMRVRGGIDAIARDGCMTGLMIGNARHARAHGLIVSCQKGSGRFLLPRKAGAFLRNEWVWRTAIVDIVTGRTIGYYEPDGKVRLSDLLKIDPAKEQPFWWHHEYRPTLDSIMPVPPPVAKNGQLFP